MGALVQIIFTFSIKGACGDNIEAQVVVFVDDGTDADFDVLVNIDGGVIHTVTYVEGVTGTAFIDALHHIRIKHICFAEILSGLAVETTEFSHLFIDVKQPSVFIVERHGNDIGLKHTCEFVARFLVDAFIFKVVGDVLEGIDNVMGYFRLPFDNGCTFKCMPIGFKSGAEIELAYEIAVVIVASDERLVVFDKFFFGRRFEMTYKLL